MKRKFISIASVSLLLVTAVNAQTVVGEQAFRRYQFWDNWYVGANAGTTHTMFSRVDPTASLNVGKWVTPVTGVRIQGEWGRSRSLYPLAVKGKDYIERISGFGDVMFNLHNLFGTYKENRFFNINYFLGFGATHGLEDGKVPGTNFFSGRTGLQFAFRLNEKWGVHFEPLVAAVDDLLDGKDSDSDFDLHANMLLGFTYRFKNSDGGRDFKLLPVCDDATLRAMNDEINNLRKLSEEQKRMIQSQANTIGDKDATIRKQEQELIKAIECCENKKFMSPRIDYVMFRLDKSVIDPNQEINVYTIGRYLKENQKANVIVTGYADVQTGSSKYNKDLSKRRVETVKARLIKEYGIAENRIKIVYLGSDQQIFDKNDWNRVAVLTVED